MNHYEYKVVPAPRRAKRVRGVKAAEELFALTLTDAINEVARQGWEYVRAEHLPAEAPGAGSAAAPRRSRPCSSSGATARRWGRGWRRCARITTAGRRRPASRSRWRWPRSARRWSGCRRACATASRS